MNKPVTCIIVDDEPPAIRVLEKFVEQLPGLTCIATTTKPVEALMLIEKMQPDIVFLDIQMPDITGIQLSALVKSKTNIVFTTAYAQFALEGFEVDAVDYLLKPIAFNRFIAAVEKVKNRMQSVTGNVTQESSNASFFIKTDGKNRFRRVEIDDIYYIESIKNYVMIYLEKDKIMTYNTLKYYEENLPLSLFVKIHKSFVVAINKIISTDSDEVYILNSRLPIGETYKNDFFEKINQRKL